MSCSLNEVGWLEVQHFAYVRGFECGLNLTYAINMKLGPSCISARAN